MTKERTMFQNEYVSTQGPWGMTDGSYICSRCKEWTTGCSLCIGQPISLIRIASR